MCLEYMLGDGWKEQMTHNKGFNNFNFVLDLIALHTFIADAQPTFGELLENHLYSRIACHALSICHIRGSSGIRFQSISNKIADKYDWDVAYDYEFVNFKNPIRQPLKYSF